MTTLGQLTLGLPGLDKEGASESAEMAAARLAARKIQQAAADLSIETCQWCGAPALPLPQTSARGVDLPTLSQRVGLKQAVEVGYYTENQCVARNGILRLVAKSEL